MIRLLSAVLVSAVAVSTQEPLPRLVPLEPTLGCVACDGPETFGVVLAVSVGIDGALAVADRDPPHVRLFEADGALRTTFGRSGEGPGEFGVPGGVALLESGRLVVADFRWMHVGVFDQDGSVLRTYDVESTTSVLAGDPTGRWVSWQVADWTTMSAGVSLLSPDGAMNVPLASTVDRIVDDEGEATALGLFATAPGPDGRVALGAPPVYRILVLRPDGSTLHEIRRDIPRTARTDEEIEAREEALRRGPAGARAGNPEGAARPEVDPLRPHFQVDGLAYDTGSRLWVRTPRGGPGRTVFDLFSAEGEYVGELPLEVELETFTIGGDVLAGVVEDRVTGVPRVMRWRIEG